MRQLAMGIRVEREHKPTITFLKRYVRQHKKLPSDRTIYKHIAQNHIRESRTYYTKLKKLKL